MRSSACVTSLALFLCIALQLAPTFPIPKDMHETWAGAKLSEADKRLLWKAIAAELGDESEDRVQLLSFKNGDHILVVLDNFMVYIQTLKRASESAPGGGTGLA